MKPRVFVTIIGVMADPQSLSCPNLADQTETVGFDVLGHLIKNILFDRKDASLFKAFQFKSNLTTW